MSHTVDIAQKHRTGGVEEETLAKGVTHVRPGEGRRRSLWVFGELVTCKVASDQTGGAYSLFEVVSRPGEDGPPPHVEHRHDEAFWVLDGEYEFVVEGRIIRAGTGSLVYVPKGNLHAHKNLGEEPGRMLVSQTPGGSHERFFEEIGEETKEGSTSPASEDPPHMESIAKIAAEYGIEMPLPRRSYN